MKNKVLTLKNEEYTISLNYPYVRKIIEKLEFLNDKIEHEGMMDSVHSRLHNTGNNYSKGYRKDTSGRKCSNCESHITYINPKNYKIWHRDGKGGYLCQKCFEKTRPKRIKSTIINNLYH